MVFNNKFILASSSKSRYLILKNNKLLFTKIHPTCNESFFKSKLLKKNTPIDKISLELARLKSKSISIKHPKKLIVGGDTTINFKGRLLTKAKNLKEAKKIIISISGKTHHIFSSASVFLNKKEVWSATQKSTIKIRKLSDEEADNYLFLVGKKILTSVGCYQAEAAGPHIIEEIKGDFFNVLGFPLFPFLKFLKEYKIRKKL